MAFEEAMGARLINVQDAAKAFSVSQWPKLKMKYNRTRENYKTCNLTHFITKFCRKCEYPTSLVVLAGDIYCIC